MKLRRTKKFMSHYKSGPSLCTTIFLTKKFSRGGSVLTSDAATVEKFLNGLFRWFPRNKAKLDRTVRKCSI
jgi:hypothetical protein